MTYTDDEFDRDTKRYLQLEEIVTGIVTEQEAIKARIRTRGIGAHRTVSGIGVKITPPNRSFNLDTAVSMLDDGTLAQCHAEGYDAKKVRRFLTPDQTDKAMEPGRGQMRVSIG